MTAFPPLLTRLRLMLLRLRALARKELLTLLRDPGVRRILVVPIIAQSILFGYGATFNLERVPWAALDASRSPASEAVLRAIDANGIFERACAPRSLEALSRCVGDGEALIGIVIPDDFARRLARGESAEVFLAADARNSSTANVATGYVSAILEQINASGALAEAAGVRTGGAAGAVRLVERYRYNENGVTRHNIMTGLILGLAMIQVMLLAGLAVSREREEGSFDMMLMTPLSPVEILAGKAFAPIVIGVLQSLMILCVCRFWFEIPFAGSLGLLILVVTLFSTRIVGIALAISAWASTLLESVVIAFVLLLPSLVLSGLMTPVMAMPEWLQTLTVMNPVRCGILTIRMIYFENAGLAEILPHLWPIALISCVTIPGAAWLFRNKVA